MPITLAEAKATMVDPIDQTVVDTFRRSSWLLDNMTFNNCVSPGTGGSTLVYGWTMLKTASTAATRAINSEYTASEAIREKKTGQCAIMGGSYQIDRVLQDTSGALDELGFQAEQKIKATANLFHYLAVNGAGDGTDFTGLAKLLSGSSTEVTSTVDISTGDLMTANAQSFLDELDSWLTTMDGTPDALLMNAGVLTKVRAVARRCGYYERSKDDFGKPVELYNGIRLVDMGKYFDGKNTTDVVADVSGTSSIFAVSLGLDGFFGFSPTGTGVVRQYTPDLSQPGAVKQGEVELVAGVALKNTLKAGVLKGIKTSSVTSTASAKKS